MYCYRYWNDDARKRFTNNSLSCCIKKLKDRILLCKFKPHCSNWQAFTSDFTPYNDVIVNKMFKKIHPFMNIEG